MVRRRRVHTRRWQTPYLIHQQQIQNPRWHALNDSWLDVLSWNGGGWIAKQTVGMVMKK
jgi:hypothetical protein